MITRRKYLIASGSGLCLSAASHPVFSQQQPVKVPRVGILSSESATDPVERSHLEVILSGLRALGYETDKNIIIELRYAESKYERLQRLATELVQLKVDVIVALGIKATVEAKRVTSTIPIILPNTSSDLIEMGLAASLARPGGNVTGSSIFGPEIMGKRLELAKEALPRAERIGILLNAANPSYEPVLREVNARAKSLKVMLLPFKVLSRDEFAHAISSMLKQRIGALLVGDDTLFRNNAHAIADIAFKHRIPAVGSAFFGESGGLMGYGANAIAMMRGAAVYVDKILKGTRAGDLPIERATRFDMVVNLKIAKSLGIKMPPTIMVQATRVIE